jgi:integrase
MEELHDMKGFATSAYVLPGARCQGHFNGLHKSWVTVRTWAEIPDVRIHDLRRSFASVAAINGESLLMIGKLLGHADPKTTQIYAHLTDTALHTAADSTAERIAAAMATKNTKSS